MLPDPGSRLARLFVFEVPGLPEMHLALTLPEALEIGPLRRVMQVPFSPAHILGLALWREQLATVLDLAAALLGRASQSAVSGDDRHFLMAQVAWNKQREILAWPVQDGAASVTIPFQAARSSPALPINPDLVYATIRVADQDVVVLNLPGLLVNPPVSSRHLHRPQVAVNPGR